MEWIETTGRSVDDAVEAALDQLGVDLEELEFEVVQEPKSGLFGRIGGSEARIRARVRPISREKPDTRRRRPRGEKRGAKGAKGAGNAGVVATAERAPTSANESPADESSVDESSVDESPSGNGNGSSGSSRRRRGGRGRGRGAAATEGAPVDERDEAQDAAAAEAAADFVDGLVEAFGLDGEANAVAGDDQWTIAVSGQNLGALIGPKAATLDAITELARTVVAKTVDGRGPKVVVDVAGYRTARRESLEQFTRECATRALETGRAQALEPMHSVDRKIVHDTVTSIDGVRTISEGEDRRRRVVILPE